MWTLRRGLLAAVLLSAVAATVLEPVVLGQQTAAGAIAGTVRDGSGAGLPGVTVTVLLPDGATAASTTTDSGGAYTIDEAPSASIAAPDLTILSDSTSGSERTLRFRVTPKRGVRLVAVHLADGGRLFRATVGGRAVPSDWLDANPFGIVYHAPAADGVEMTFVAPAGPVKLRVSDGSDGLAGLPEFIPRPADVSAVGSHSSDLVLVARTLTL